MSKDRETPKRHWRGIWKNLANVNDRKRGAQSSQFPNAKLH
jgi:hypothetical protein